MQGIDKTIRLCAAYGSEVNREFGKSWQISTFDLTFQGIQIPTIYQRTPQESEFDLGKELVASCTGSRSLGNRSVTDLTFNDATDDFWTALWDS
jgi:hypothetical protein